MLRTSLFILVVGACAACGDDAEPNFQPEDREARRDDDREPSPDDDDREPSRDEEPGDDDEPAGLAAPPDVAAPPDGAERTESGLASRVLEEGDGTRHPGPTSTVEVHYTGWTTDGERFDSSVARGEPTSFPLNGVIPGWTEGVQLMVVGEKRRFWIPGNLAYDGVPNRPQGMLVFDVQLLRILD